MNIELSTKLGILHSRFGGCESKLGGDDKGKTCLVCGIEGSLLKVIDSGYASQYSNMLNTYMKTRLYNKSEHSYISENGDVRSDIMKM